MKFRKFIQACRRDVDAQIPPPAYGKPRDPIHLLEEPYTMSAEEQPKVARFTKKQIAAAVSGAAAVFLTLTLLWRTGGHSLPVDTSSYEEPSSAPPSGSSVAAVIPPAATTASTAPTGTQAPPSSSADTTAPTTTASTQRTQETKAPQIQTVQNAVPSVEYLEQGGWTNEDSLCVTLREDGAQRGRLYSPSDFPEVKAREVVVSGFDEKYLSLIVVLEPGEDMDKALEALRANPLVESAAKNTSVPYTYKKKLVLRYSEITMEVGASVEEDVLFHHIGNWESASNSTLSITMPAREEPYEAADFPRLNPDKVENHVYDFRPDVCYLTVEKSGMGYFEAIRQIGLLYAEEACLGAQRVPLERPALEETPAYYSYDWKLSDSSIVQMEGRLTEENDEGYTFSSTPDSVCGAPAVILKACRPGTATLRLSYGDVYDVCTIRVVE